MCCNLGNGGVSTSLWWKITVLSSVQRKKIRRFSTKAIGKNQLSLLLSVIKTKEVSEVSRLFKRSQISTVIVTFTLETLKKERINSFNTEREISSKYSKLKDFRSAKRKAREAPFSQRPLALRKMSPMSSLLQGQCLCQLLKATHG